MTGKRRRCYTGSMAEQEQQQPQPQSEEPQEGAPRGCLIALFMVPVFVLVAAGILHVTKKMDPATVKMTATEDAAFEEQYTEEEVAVSSAAATEPAAETPTEASTEKEDRAITLAAVEKLAGKPVSLRKLLNMGSEIDALLNHKNTLELLKNKKLLQAYLAKSPEVGLFLFSPAITSLSADRRSLDAALSSQLVGKIGNAPAVQALLHDQKALLETVKANEQLAEFLKLPEVSEALKAFSQSGVIEGLDTPAMAELLDRSKGKKKSKAKRGSERL